MSELNATTELCRLLGDPTRIRLLSLLDQHELAVGELAAITQPAQPRISTHLGKLREAGLVHPHRDGAQSLYRLAEEDWSPATAALVRAVLNGADDPLLAQDALRVDAVLAARQGASTWADAVAGQMASHYSPGRTWEAVARGLVGLAALGRVIDIAAGDGAVAELLAPHAEHIACVDISERVVGKARARLAHLPNLSVHRGDMHALPFPDASFDHALLLAGLSYSADPPRALAEAARVLRPRGRLVATTLHTHAHRAEVARYDHQNLGIDPDRLRAMCEAAGLQVRQCAVTSRERRPPHLEIVTLHAVRS